MSFIIIMFPLPFLKILFMCLMENSFNELETWKVKPKLSLSEIGISEFGQAGLISIRLYFIKKQHVFMLWI